VEKTCKIWRTTRAQRFECYCREFEMILESVGSQCNRSSAVVDLIGNEEFWGTVILARAFYTSWSCER